jgi:hypothetical protein
MNIESANEIIPFVWKRAQVSIIDRTITKEIIMKTIFDLAMSHNRTPAS